MGRRLNRAVVAGGVRYPAGTTATPEIEAKITNPKYWDGEPEARTRGGRRAPAPNGQFVRVTGDYATQGVPTLKTEVELRNADRDPDGDAYIKVHGRGNKADLVEALNADDLRHQGTATDQHPITGDYDEHDLEALVAEVARRNADPDRTDPLELDESADVDDVAALLEADDED